MHYNYKLLTLIVLILLGSGLRVLGQKDTVSINLKHSKLIIVSDSETENEWDFEGQEKENFTNKKRSKKISSVLNIGNCGLSNNKEAWVWSYNNRIPIEKSKSINWGYNLYANDLKLLNDFISFHPGVGFQSYQIGLNNFRVSQINDSLQFSMDSLFNPIKNKLRCNYLSLPLLIGLHPLIKTKPRFQLQMGIGVEFRIGSNLITKERFIDGFYKTKTKNHHQLSSYFINYKMNLIFKRIGIYSQFSLSPLFNDSPNDLMFSIGILLSNLK